MSWPATGDRPGWQRPSWRPTRDLVVEDAETGFCGAVVRCEKAARRTHRHAGGPARPAAGLPPRTGLPRRRLPRHPGPPERPPTAGTRRDVPPRVGRRRRRPARVAPSQPHLRRGPPRRRARRAGLGRRPARRGRRRRVPRRHRRPRRRRRDFRPAAGRRLGVLVDHLVPGSKESRHRGADRRHRTCCVVGHPYVDVWQAVRPAAVGIAAWPDVPRGQPWKEGVCRGLGWPIDTRGGVAAHPGLRRSPTPTSSRACSAGSRR